MLGMWYWFLEGGPASCHPAHVLSCAELHMIPKFQHKVANKSHSLSLSKPQPNCSYYLREAYIEGGRMFIKVAQ
jgi:hypothetical protein